MEKTPHNSKNDYVLGKFGISLQEGLATWVTGSSSASLIGIEEYATKCGDPALVPTGRLLRDHNIVPLTGECGFGLSKNGINNEHLSGVLAYNFVSAFSYAKEALKWTFNKKETLERLATTVDSFGSPKDIFYFSINEIKVPILRLLQYGELTQEEHQRVEALIQKLLGNLQKPFEILKRRWEDYGGLLGTPAPEPDPSLKRLSKDLAWEVVGIRQEDGSISFAFFQTVHDQYQSICVVDTEGTKKRIPRENIVFYGNGQIKKRKAPSLLPKDIQDLETEAQRLIDCTKTSPKTLSERQIKWINNPFPIVWASTSIKEEQTTRLCGQEVEHAFKGPLGLGKDIQYAFTGKEYMKELSSIVSPWGITVIHCKGFDRK